MTSMIRYGLFALGGLTAAYLLFSKKGPEAHLTEEELETLLDSLDVPDLTLGNEWEDKGIYEYVVQTAGARPAPGLVAGAQVRNFLQSGYFFLVPEIVIRETKSAAEADVASGKKVDARTLVSMSGRPIAFAKESDLPRLVGRKVFIASLPRS